MYHRERARDPIGGACTLSTEPSGSPYEFLRLWARAPRHTGPTQRGVKPPDPPGRPKKVGGVSPVTAVRLPTELGAYVDEWAMAQADEPSPSEAIRRLVELGLKTKPKA